MRETEASKAGQASINVLGRWVIFKIPGTMVVIKAFDLFLIIYTSLIFKVGI